IFKDAYGELIKKGADQVYGAILLVIGTQGVPEAIVAGVLTAAIASILLRLNRKNNTEHL
ncbi:MAG TPA: ECF transporter S component, partial [Candidatus Enterococcus stercoravium]|nr:ECF transporter S component [Candidatus Enterococcus stercoravium]